MFLWIRHQASRQHAQPQRWLIQYLSLDLFLCLIWSPNLARGLTLKLLRSTQLAGRSSPSKAQPALGNAVAV